VATSTLNIVAVTDGAASSATTVMTNIAKHSKHNIEVFYWDPHRRIQENTDIVYVHYGGLLTPWSKKINDFIKEHREVKWIAGIRGVLNFRRWTNSWLPTKFCDFVHALDGISTANKKFQSMAEKLAPDIPVFTCHSGVDIDMFQPSPLPKHFCIGWAGMASAGSKMFGNFMSLPFPSRTAAGDAGTWRYFKHMPAFYPTISVYVSTSVEEGSPLPPKEAAACARPVVAIDVGDFAEWVPERYLVPNYKNSYKLLTPIIQELMDDRNLLEAESKRFRELSIQWDYKTVARTEYDVMFETVMKG
jgi:glycosyltransferase involved in cell wall biosynthesis